jgi:hypothetical protein
MKQMKTGKFRRAEGNGAVGTQTFPSTTWERDNLKAGKQEPTRGQGFLRPGQDFIVALREIRGNARRASAVGDGGDYLC